MDDVAKPNTYVLRKKMDSCKHEFVCDELCGQAVCKKCGYVLTREDKQSILRHSMALLKQEEEKQRAE